MKARKPPVLTVKDLARIRVLISQECLQANKEVRKEIRQLRKENMDLWKQKQIDNAIMTDAETRIQELMRDRDEWRCVSEGWESNYQKLKKLYSDGLDESIQKASQ